MAVSVKKNNLLPGIKYKMVLTFRCTNCIDTIFEYSFQTGMLPEGGSCSMTPDNGKSEC